MVVQRFLLSLILTLAAGLAAPCPAGEPTLPPPYYPEPVFIQLRDGEFCIESIDMAYDMGIRGIRCGLYWKQVEQADGTYDFSHWEQEFAHARKKGMRIICYLFGNNPKHENDPGVGGIQTEPGRQGFAKFAAAAAARFKDHDIIWEVWTEPNVRSFWRKNRKQVGDVPPAKHNSQEFANEYAALVKETARQMLQADPEAFILAGSVSNFWEPSYRWQEMCFAQGILDSGIKGWSMHPYGIKLPEDSIDGYRTTRQQLAKFGKPAFPVLNTERGYAWLKHPDGEETAMALQAALVVRMCMIEAMMEIRATTLLQLVGHDNHAGGGKYRLVGRPAGAAVKVMCEQLDGYKFVKRLPAEHETDYVLLWENQDGGRKLVAWTAPPVGGNRGEAQAHAVTIEGLSGEVPMVDLLGKAGTATGQFPLSGSVIYLDVPKGATPGKAQVVPGTLKEVEAP